MQILRFAFYRVSVFLLFYQDTFYFSSDKHAYPDSMSDSKSHIKIQPNDDRLSSKMYKAHGDKQQIKQLCKLTPR